MRNFFERLLNRGKKKGFMFTTKSLAMQTGNGDRIRSSGGIPINDFISVNDGLMQSWSSSSAVISSLGSSPVKLTDERKAVEPKAVFEEIKRETPEISFDNLDAKIDAVTERIQVLSEHLDESHLGDEHRTLFYLKNRRTYLKTIKKDPLDWAMTTQDAVDDLCKRYKLRVVPLKQYYTLVPKEGIKEMKRYSDAYKKITGDSPIFELVIKDSDVIEERKEQRKKDRDPIMVANSPLGNFLFIIGAWDDEVEIVDEIIYGLK